MHSRGDEREVATFVQKVVAQVARIDDDDVFVVKAVGGVVGVARVDESIGVPPQLSIVVVVKPPLVDFDLELLGKPLRRVRGVGDGEVDVGFTVSQVVVLGGEQKAAGCFVVDDLGVEVTVASDDADRQGQSLFQLNERGPARYTTSCHPVSGCRESSFKIRMSTVRVSWNVTRGGRSCRRHRHRREFCSRRSYRRGRLPEKQNDPGSSAAAVWKLRSKGRNARRESRTHSTKLTRWGTACNRRPCQQQWSCFHGNHLIA